MRCHSRATVATLAALVVGILCVAGTASPAWAQVEPGAEDCPNREIRSAQLSTFLADCRAYEQVSPNQKNGFDVLFPRGNAFQANKSGSEIVYSANGAFPGAAASLPFTFYRSSRGQGDWASESIELPQFNARSLWFLSVISTSADLSHTVGFSSEALTPGAVQGHFNLYMRTNATGALELIASMPAAPWILESGYAGTLAGTPSFDHFVFAEPQQLTNDAPATGEFKLYEFSGGSLSLISRLPSGEPSPGRADFGLPAMTESIADEGRAVSEDGSRVFFNLGFEGSEGLYVREGGQTRPISVSQRQGDGPEPRQATLASATADGSVVYFTSKEGLTDDATPGVTALYRYELDTGHLEDLTAGGLEVEPYYLRPAASRDGKYVYFMASGAVRVWHEGAIRTIVPALTEEDPAGPTIVRMSPSGAYLAYETYAQHPGYDNSNPAACPGNFATSEPAGLCREVYLYDAFKGESRCVSCDTNGDRPAGHASLGSTGSNAVTDDGRVFFNSPDRLVLGDSNGKTDVYEWRNGVQRLISSGRGASKAGFVTASVTGSDVFFTTDQQLVATDRDSNVDLYDARVGGGVAGQNPLAAEVGCMGSECQGWTSSFAPPAAVGSARIGAAKKPPRARCRSARKRATARRSAGCARNRHRGAKGSKHRRGAQKTQGSKQRKNGGNR